MREVIYHCTHTFKHFGKSSVNGLNQTKPVSSLSLLSAPGVYTNSCLTALKAGSGLFWTSLYLWGLKYKGIQLRCFGCLLNIHQIWIHVILAISKSKFTLQKEDLLPLKILIRAEGNAKKRSSKDAKESCIICTSTLSTSLETRQQSFVYKLFFCF